MNRFLPVRPGRAALALSLALAALSGAAVLLPGLHPGEARAASEPGGAAGATATTAAPAARPATDLLDRPARLSPRAEGAVLIGVARAGSRLVAAGERGTLLLSDDNGAHWRQAPAPVSVALTALAFPTPQAGWAVGHGGVILATSDGGEHWSRQLDGRQIGAIEVAAAEASGDARALSDARHLADEGPDKPLLDVAFADAQRGIAVGAFGLALATDDGGRSWHSIRARLPNKLGKHLYDVVFDGDRVLVAGEQGALFRSTDGGAHFEEVKTPYAGSFFGVLPGDGGALLLYGLRGTVLRSTDNGASWTRIDLGQPVTVSAGARLADGSLVLADETGRVLASHDGGASFAPRPVERPFAFTGAVQAGDGSLVLSGVRGLARLAASAGGAVPATAASATPPAAKAQP